MDLENEKKRKAIHFATSWVPLAYYVIPEHLGKIGLLLGAVVILFLDILRLHEPRIKNLFYKFFGEMIREHEKATLLGATSLVISALLTVFCFQKNVAVASLFFLTIGDTTAALVGTRYGRIRIFGKTLEGSLACFTACVLIGIVVPGIPPFVALAGALVATLFEVLPIPLDDNFRVPLSAGFMMQMLMPH